MPPAMPPGAELEFFNVSGEGEADCSEENK